MDVDFRPLQTTTCRGQNWLATETERQTSREKAMNGRISVLSLAAALLICDFAAQAQTAPTSVTQTKQSMSIADLAWLAGRWIGEGLGGQMEEVWSPPAGPQMVGHFRLEQDGMPALYELMLLDEFDGGLRMRVKHFNPTFAGWEEKGAWHTFGFVSGASGVLVLDGLALRRAGPGRLTMQLSLERADGSVATETLDFRRAPL